MPWLKRCVRDLFARPRSNHAHLRLEPLESRLTPYAVSGNAWPTPQKITLSFVPDGTNLNGYTSNLFATFNTKFGSVATWQNQILKAAQTWAQQTNINFCVVSDNGAALGSGSYQQGDSGFGDIRIGGYNFGNTTLAQAYLPPPVANYSVAGDIQFNTSRSFNVGSTYDLYTVAMHEFGHALGLYHGAAGSVMTGTYASARSGLATDDVNGIRNVYSANAARAKDSYDTTATNETSATATLITSAINTTTKAAVLNNMDLTTSTDVDWYKFVVPTGSSATLKAKAISTGLSLLNPKIEIYNSSLALLATGTAGAYGGTATATFGSLVAGQTYYVKVLSTDSTAAFKTGRYALVLNMGTGTDPAPTLVNALRANGSPLSAGGGQAIVLSMVDTSVNTVTTGTQVTSAPGQRSIASDFTGNAVVVWADSAQDGSGYGVYARRYDEAGVAQGPEFRVNTTTGGDQTTPSVAMDPFGNSVIVWASLGQDGSGWGIYAQRFDSKGEAQGGEFQVNSTKDGDQTLPVVALDAWGNFVIAWASAGQDGGGLGVYAQRYGYGGVAQGTEFLVNSTTSGDQTTPSIACHRITGSVTITWVSLGQDGSGWGVYAQRYGRDGNADGSEFLVNTTTAGDQATPCVAVNRMTGEFVITWASKGQDGSGWGIYARQFDKEGVAEGDELRINTTTSGDQKAPCVAIDSAGNSFITWTSSGQDGNGTGVYAQLLGADGTLHETEFRVNVTTSGSQGVASLTVSTVGQAIVVWCGNGPTDGSGIMMQRYDLGMHAYASEEHHDAEPVPEVPVESAEVESLSLRQADSNGSATSPSPQAKSLPEQAAPAEAEPPVILPQQASRRRGRGGPADQAQEALTDAVFAGESSPA